MALISIRDKKGSIYGSESEEGVRASAVPLICIVLSAECSHIVIIDRLFHFLEMGTHSSNIPCSNRAEKRIEKFQISANNI